LPGKKKIVAFTGSFFTWASVALAQQASFSPRPYLEDYRALREHISKSYANLEYLLQYYEIDPFELNAKTVAAINASKNEKEAGRALDDFVNAFRDGHFALKRLEAGESRQASPSTIDRKASGELACKAMGFASDKRFAFRFPIEGVKIVRKGGDEFPFLIVDKNGSKVGIIRISDFRDEAYPAICSDTWSIFSKSLNADCDEKCRDAFLQQAMSQALVDKFYESLEQVRADKPQALVIDLTHNGGGTDWAKDITALLTKEKLACGRRGFIKHPHYVKIFTDELRDLKSASKPDSAKIKDTEEKAKIASENCDRSPIWTQRDIKLACSAVAYVEGDSCRYEDLNFKGKARYAGKLFFLVDGHTASAAEDIVARHIDSKTAIAIGEHTRGSGCGYMNGGIKFRLPHSGLAVKVPDCIRERADGTNEVVGIEPGIKMDMTKIESPDFINRVTERVLSSLKD
jgi:hypothetical protein